MSMLGSHRVAAFGLLCALVVTACGQKPGVHVEDPLAGSQAVADDQADAGGDDPADGGGNDPADGGGNDQADADGNNGAAPAQQPAQVGGDQQQPAQVGGDQQQPVDEGGQEQPVDEGGQEQPTEGQTTAPPASGTRPVTGSDRTGVTDEKITVAFHAPVTGAAPLPAESFREARDLYWQWEASQGRKFLGRDEVEVLFTDDKYDPANARQVCRQQAAQAFIVAGGGGTDQIQACGQLAGSQGFPYFSAGVTEVGLDDNPWYFASSMTYRQQGFLLAQWIRANHAGKKFAAIITQTGNFDDAAQGFQQGVQEAGIQDDLFEIMRHPKGDSSWYSPFAQRLSDAEVEVVYMLTSPVDYIDFAKRAANNSGYRPQYVGVGVSMGLNAILPTGCDEVGGGQFFSPFPGLDWARQNVPEFFEAADEFGKVADDLALALWGINKQVDVMFQEYERVYGTDLTREDFRDLVESMGTISTGIFPDVAFSPDNHFGGTSVHVLQADCQQDPSEYVTLATFATGF